MQIPAPNAWSPNALAVFRARYLKRDEHTHAPSETPEQLLRRVARHVAAAELAWGASETERLGWEENFFALLCRGIFLPNSPTLMNSGRELGLLSACIVLPIEDSIESIFETLKHTALIQKAGGGTGFDFSRLRPRGDLVRSSGGKASGPVSFLHVYSTATSAIQQGAFRRGANMGILRTDHPDIVEFIRSKDDRQSLTNFNISVSIPDEFIRQVESDPRGPHFVRNPRTGKHHRLARGGRTGEYWTAGEVFDLITERACATGEPGVIFLDRINRDNPTPALGTIAATNPCSEQPLLPYEACTLGSINLVKFTSGAGLDWANFRQTVRTATRFLDDVVEVNRLPVPETERLCRLNRKIGLGIMGFADALFALSLPYDSDDAVALGERIMETLNETAHDESEALARVRGPFPAWKGSRWDTKEGRPQRNATVSTIAPTGTISILAGCSGGIEPVFSLAFHRNILDGGRFLEVNPIFIQAARERGFYSTRLVERLLETGTLQTLEELPSDMKQVFQTARDVSPEAHVRMQAAFQRHCDSGISKTINFPGSATPADVRSIYLKAFHAGVKGVTVYRDGSRPHQPMALNHCKGCE